MKDRYESPLAGRYASEYMTKLLSQRTRTETWRKLWTALAEAEMELGLPITSEQVEEMRAHIGDIDFDRAAAQERKVRHDVMAHIYTYGEAAPSAKGIIHLGATSCFVTDNADLIIYKDALLYIRQELKAVIKTLSDFAARYKDVPTLGYTHYQPAQLVTVGKRATLWIEDFVSDLSEVEYVLSIMKLRGARGTTGTEASFMELFEGDEDKVRRLNELLSERFGFDGVYPVTGQTYPRKLDSRIMNALSAIAQSAYRMATDVRLLQHDRELEEPFESEQIGSSAMPYKRNPMRSERICSLSRYIMADAQNAVMTASTQWLERTLDDSANRRIAVPEGFLAADAVLRLTYNVAGGLVVNEAVIAARVKEYLPFIATENIMMEAVKRGGDRQKLHAVLRKLSLKAAERMKKGEQGGLTELLMFEPELKLSPDEIGDILDPARYTGRAGAQVSEYLADIASLVKDAPESLEDIEV